MALDDIIIKNAGGLGRGVAKTETSCIAVAQRFASSISSRRRVDIETDICRAVVISNKATGRHRLNC